MKAARQAAGGPPLLETHGLVVTPEGQGLLARLKAGDPGSPEQLRRLPAHERAYLAAERAVRTGAYSALEPFLGQDVPPSIASLSTCYRDLFTDPRGALRAVKRLREERWEEGLSSRLTLWHAHLSFLVGDEKSGKRFAAEVPANALDGTAWELEGLAIRSLAHYFLGRTADALESHRECQVRLEETPDHFVQIFNSAMAMRAALKLSDAGAFERFAESLDACFRLREDDRYRLRHTGYRAMILNQLGEPEAAEEHWREADRLLQNTESHLERGQYLLLRGLAHALRNDFAASRAVHAAAEGELHRAGSPPLYLAELDIARGCAELASPSLRARRLEASVRLARAGKHRFRRLASRACPLTVSLYEEARRFCESLLEGASREASPSRQPRSLVLSIIDNVSRNRVFAAGVSHFRLLPNFVHSLEHCCLTREGIARAIERVTGMTPLIREEKFDLPVQGTHLKRSPEVRTLLNFASVLLDLGQKAERTHASEALASLAAQIAHDIRSPLSALYMVTRDTEPLDEERRGLVQAALGRIQGIANDLLAQYRVSRTAEATPSVRAAAALPEKQHLAGLVEIIVGEKRLKYLERPGVLIEAELGARTYGLFASVEPVEYLRVLSNLVDNAAEAIDRDKRGTVTIGIASDGEEIVTTVRDTGRGMAPALLDRIREEAFSYGKEDGNGLGLEHAKRCAKIWGGSLAIDSVEGGGTTIRLRVPLASPPAWFARELRLSPTSPVLVLDDDEAVHELWSYRLGTFGEGVSVVHCRTIDEARAALALSARSFSACLLDYELRGSRTTGLDLILEFNLERTALLVTGRAEEPRLIDACVGRGVKLLPKSLAPHLPITAGEAPALR